MKKEEQITENEQLRQTPVSGLLQLLKAKKEINYQKIELIKTQVQRNDEFIARLKLESENLIDDAIRLREEIQELSEHIDYAFLCNDR